MISVFGPCGLLHNRSELSLQRHLRGNAHATESKEMKKIAADLDAHTLARPILQLLDPALDHEYRLALQGCGRFTS